MPIAFLSRLGPLKLTQIGAFCVKPHQNGLVLSSPSPPLSFFFFFFFFLRLYDRSCMNYDLYKSILKRLASGHYVETRVARFPHACKLMILLFRRLLGAAVCPVMMAGNGGCPSGGVGFHSRRREIIR